jgi:hypothetical protein
MGASQSNTYNQNVQEKTYTEGEIRDRINQLFLSNKNNPFSESSIATMNTVLDLESTAYTDQFGGNAYVPNVNVVPRRHRYDNYDIDGYLRQLIQQGGQNENEGGYEQISELSEFDRIRDYLKADIAKTNGDNQVGGNNMEFSSELNMPSPTSINSNEVNFNILDALRGGADREPSEDSNDVKDSDDVEDSDAQPTDDDTETDIVTDISDDSEKKEKKDKKKKEDDTDEEKTEEEKINSYSETSFSSKSSDINILPFYSTSSSSNNSFKHPYVKNRFN